MSDRTKQIVDVVLRASELVEALKQDPKAFASRFGVGDRELELLHTGKRVLSEVAGRLRSPGSDRHGRASVVAPNVSRANGMGSQTLVSDRQGFSTDSSVVAVAGVASLTALVGMVAALGTVALVAMGRKESDRV